MRVLVVDNHDLFRTGLRALLTESGFAVNDASSAETALHRLRSFPADVVLMDMRMPGMGGYAATALITQQAPRVRVIFLTVAANDADIVAAFRAGACGFLLKEAQLDEIVGAIHAAAAGHSPVAPPVASALIAHVCAAEPATDCGEVPALSPRERDVLALVTEGRDNGEIGRRLFLSPSTVKSHVSRLLEKLGVENRVQAAVYATRHQLVAA
jgi:two-component system, NarL family, nitrate/nitrite response regulator NarL